MLGIFLLAPQLEKVKAGELTLTTEEDEEGGTTTIFEMAGAEDEGDAEMADGEEGEGNEDY